VSIFIDLWPQYLKIWESGYTYLRIFHLFPRCRAFADLNLDQPPWPLCGYSRTHYGWPFCQFSLTSDPNIPRYGYRGIDVYFSCISSMSGICWPQSWSAPMGSMRVFKHTLWVTSVSILIDLWPQYPKICESGYTYLRIFHLFPRCRAFADLNLDLSPWPICGYSRTHYGWPLCQFSLTSDPNIPRYGNPSQSECFVSGMRINIVRFRIFPDPILERQYLP